MIQKCRICQSSFDKKVTSNKHMQYVPDVCSGKCFSALLRGKGNGYRPRANPLLVKPEQLRSNYERRMLAWLEKKEFYVQYEPFKFMLADRNTYTPDFYLKKGNVLLEVKGIWEPGYWTKFSGFIEEQGNNYTVYIIDEPFMRRIGCGR